MSYLDSAGQDQSPSFLQQLARSLGLDQPAAPPANRQALAAALSGQPAAPPGTHYAQLPGPPLLLSGGGNAPPPPAQAQAQAPGPATPMRGSMADMRLPGMAPAAVMPQGAPATAAAAPSSLIVPGYEAKGPLTRAQVAAAPDDDKTMPAEEDWDAAAKAHGIPSAASAPQPAAAPANSYATAVKAEYATAMAGHDAEMAAARTAAAAGTPAAYALAQGHLATADRYLQMATAAQAKYDETLKPGWRTLQNAELTPAERATGAEWQASPEGQRSQVAGTEGDTTRAPNAAEAARLVAANQDPKNYEVKDGALLRIPGTEPRDAGKKELREIGEDPFTGKQYGIFDPLTGQITPYKPPQNGLGQAAIPAQIQELGLPSSDTGQGDKTPAIVLPPDQQARLAQVDPHIRSTVESILQGRLGLPKITAGRGNPLPLAITQAVLTVSPGFDANTNMNQLGTRKNFSAGGANNTPGQLIINSDSALDHFVPLVEASDALPNYGAFLGASVLGTERNVPGNFAGEDFKKKVAALQSAATPASAETMKYLAGTTGGGEEERQQLIKSWADIGGSPASRREAVKNYLDDMLAKKAELQNQWHSAMDTPNGPKAPDFPVISDSARNSVIKMGYGDLLTKYGLQGNRVQAATAAPQAPSPGFVKGGFRFKGGDPGQRQNWEPTQ